eukprot:6184367-Pleurochrysis_carterae.AAC.7
MPEKPVLDMFKGLLELGYTEPGGGLSERGFRRIVQSEVNDAFSIDHSEKRTPYAQDLTLPLYAATAAPSRPLLLLSLHLTRPCLCTLDLARTALCDSACEESATRALSAPVRRALCQMLWHGQTLVNASAWFRIET